MKRLLSVSTATAAAAAIVALSAGAASALPPGGGGTGGGTGGSAGSGTPTCTQTAIVHEQNDLVVGGLHMDTTARISPCTGVVDGEPTHIWNDYWGIGYHGSVAVELLDAYGNVIAVTDPQTYGVDGKAFFWNPSNLVEYWNQTFNPIVTEQAASMVILHTTTPRNQLLTDLNNVRNAACYVWTTFKGQGQCPLPPLPTS